ncbi:MAG: dockerin type I domain-containing protein [Clostridiales bacterium]|jgi:X-Pro dipeptidyl-peptidase|nr:dockerin type I domain-containing protein [Clostridiales bacterium]
MKTRKNRILVTVMATVFILTLIPALTLTAATEDEFGTQREYVTAMIKSAGMKDSVMAANDRDRDALAKTLGFLDNWEYNPTAVVTAEIATEMDLAMADAFKGLRDALAKDPPEPYFVGGMAQPIFPYGNSTYFDTTGEGAARFLVYVETNYDTDDDGQRDLIKVMVQLPRAAVDQGMKVATIYHAQPYNEGTNSSVSWPAALRPEGTAWLNANGDLTHDKLHAIVPPRVPAGEATTKEMVTNARWQDWRYNYSYSSSAYNATVTWGVANGNQISSLNMHDYFLVRGFALVSSAGLATVGGEGMASMGADIEVDAYKCVIDWINGDAKAYTDKTSNIEVKADWSNGYVGMTGTSYGGTTNIALATSGVKGLETVIPVAAISSWYEYQNQQGVCNWDPSYTPGLSWYILSRIGAPIWVAGNPIRARQLGYLQQLYLEALEHNGDYSEHWERRDYTVDGWYKDWGPSKIRIPILIVHGGNDNNVRPKQSVLLHQAAEKAGVETRVLWNQGHHTTPNNQQIGEYVYQEWQNLWYSNFLYKVNNNVLDMLPGFYGENNLTGLYTAYDSWQGNKKLILDNKNRVVATPEAPFDFSALPYEEPLEYEDDYFILGGYQTDADAKVNVTTSSPSTDGELPLAVSYAAADDQFITINSANGTSSWQNLLNVPTAGSTLYSIVLPEDVTVKGVVEINFRAALASLGSALNNSTSQLRVHAKLVEIARTGTTLRYYGGNSVGDTISTTTVTTGGVFRGGGLSSNNLVRFTPATTGTYRELARGWMNLALPYSDYDSNTSYYDKRINLAENIGVFHDYTLYLQPTCHTARAGNRLALILTTGGPTTAAYTGNNAFTFTIDNEASNVVIPAEFAAPQKPVTIEAADVWGKPGGTVDVTYKISGNDSGFSALDLLLPYNSSVYTPLAVKPAGELATPFFVSNPNYQTDLMRIAFAASENVKGDGLLFTVTYQVAAGLPLLGNYPLNAEVVKMQYINFADAMFDLEVNILPGTLVLGLLGDVNNDGTVTPEDAMTLLQMIVGLIPWTPRALILGDINGDGIVDTTDAALILRMVVGG